MASSASRFVSNPVSNPSSLGLKIGKFWSSPPHLNSWKCPPIKIIKSFSGVLPHFFIGKNRGFSKPCNVQGPVSTKKHTENTYPSQLWRDDDLAFSLVKSVPSLPEDQGSLISSRCHKNNTNPNHALFIREIHQKYVKKYSIRLYTIHLHQVRSPQRNRWHSMILGKNKQHPKNRETRGSVHKHRNKHNLAAHVAASRNVNTAQQHGQAHHHPPWLHMRLDF